MSTLTNTDYVNILKYYKISIPKSKKVLKQQAEKLMADKLCKCIKKLDPINESRSIGICTKSIFGRKGFTRGIFQCKTPRSVKFRKTKSKTNLKTRKNKV
jgi:hypothetical protein